MLDPIPTPTFDHEDLAALFNPRPYDPAAALAKAQAVFRDGFNPDSHWLALALICANSSQSWILDLIDWRKRKLNVPKVQAQYGYLSSGEYVLVVLALHLFNDANPLPKDGLINLRFLDDYHFELALHAIRIHSRGVR